MGKNQLYYGSGTRIVECDPVRGIDRTEVEYTPKYLIVAETPLLAEKKLLEHINSGRRRWSPYKIIGLKPGDSLPINNGRGVNPAELELLI
jgi:hypothetical protein